MSYSSNSVEKIKKKKQRLDDEDFCKTKKKPHKKRRPKEDPLDE
jgi:hypothetical protein